MSPCPLCGGGPSTLVTNRVRFDRAAEICRCPECRLVFLDQSTCQFPPDFYESAYHQTYLTHVDPDMADPAKHFEKMTIATRPWIDRVRQLLTGQEAVLDVGCSSGHLLAGIRDHARRVAGHELSRAEIAYCRDTLGLDVAGDPLETRFAPGEFDLITLVFVLEHIGDPVPFLIGLRRLLAPGGRLVIVVPNLNDPLMTLYDIPPFRQFYYCIEHLFYYTPDTLARVLAAAGLTGAVQPVQEYPLANHLHWAYCQRPSETLAARALTPGVALTGSEPPGWQAFWADTDARYQAWLEAAGVSDRLWCVAEPQS